MITTDKLGKCWLCERYTVSYVGKVIVQEREWLEYKCDYCGEKIYSPLNNLSEGNNE